jgi:SAM-dependent methyltransferase
MIHTLERLHRAFMRVTMPERHIVARFIARIGAANPNLPTGSVVDVAAGMAPYTRVLERAFPGRVHLRTDLHAATRPDFAADIQALPICDGSAAVVCVIQAIQLVDDPTKALAEARRVLAPGGLLILTFPLMQAETPNHDFWRWTDQGFARLLDAAGFETVERRTHGGLVYMFAYTLALLPLLYLVRNRQGWRTGRSSADIARLALATILTTPFNLLGFVALAIDHVLPTRAFATHFNIAARRK